MPSPMSVGFASPRRVVVTGLILVAVFAVFTKWDGGDSTSVRTNQPTDEAALEAQVDRNRVIAREQVVGAAPTQQLLPAVLPARFRVEAVSDAPPVPGSGGLSVTIYGNERSADPLRGPVLVALTSRTGVGLSGTGDEYSSSGRRVATRGRGDGTLAHWASQEGISGAVFGRGVAPGVVRDAADHTDAGQRPVIGEAGRPSDLSQIETGDPWGAHGHSVGSSLRNGTLVRYKDPATDDVIEVSMARGGSRLERLAKAGIAVELRDSTGRSSVARGEFAFGADDAIGIVWREGDDVVVVSSSGVDDQELSLVAEGLRPAAAGEFDALKRQAAEFPVTHRAGAVILFEGSTTVGNWSWAVVGTDTEFRSHVFDGTGAGGSDAITAEPHYADGTVGGPLPLFGITMQGIGDNLVFIGGYSARNVTRVVVEMEDGSAAEAELKDVGDEYPIRFWGITAELGAAREVVAFDASGQELDRRPIG